MKNITFVFVYLMSSFCALAQNYSTDVSYLHGDDKIISLRARGNSEKKKDATTMALKSAFYTLMYVGVEGINNGAPLVTKEDKLYNNRFFNDGRYLTFTRSYNEENVEKMSNKQYRSTVTLVVPYAMLLKELANAGLMQKPQDKRTIAEVEEEIGMPTIMVVPYRTDEETYSEILQKDFDRRMAVAKVQDGFNQRGAMTVDFEAKLNATKRAAGLEANNEDSNDKEVIQNSGADVYVVVDLQKEMNLDAGSRVALSMKAYETASGNVLASKQGWSNRFRTNQLDRLISYAIEDNLSNFLDAITKSFSKQVAHGKTIVLRCSFAKGSFNTMNTPVGKNGLALSMVLRNWVRSNAERGRYHIQGIVDESMIFDTVQIPAKDKDGLPMDPMQFADNLRVYLQEENVSCDTRIDGSSILVTIY